MYYLLEDNRIIKDSENFSHICFYENRKGFLYKVFSDKNYGKNRKIGKLKKQSENVFDLIEMGDCYLYQNQNMMRPDMVLINNTVMFMIFGSKAIKIPEHILAIYKPDANGNYIKVWERQDE